MSRLIQSENKMHRYLVFIILAVVLNVDYLELDEYDLASPASVEASGTIELKEMESVIGELFEMSGVSRGEGQARAVRSPSNLCILIFFIHVLVLVSELALFRLEPCPLVLSGSPLFTQGCILICATCLSICMSLRLVGRQHCRLSICSNFG